MLEYLVDIHSGRRTMASRLIQQGEQIETVQLLLGYAELFASTLSIINKK